MQAEKFFYALLALGWLWLAGHAGTAGIAQVYYDAAENFLSQQSDIVAREHRRELIAESKRFNGLALDAAHWNPQYRLQKDDILKVERGLYADASLVVTSLQQSLDNLIDAMRYEPVSAALWVRLTYAQYTKAGISADTLYALDRALQYGPQDQGTLLLNAHLTLNSGSEFEQERHREAWGDILRAMKFRSLSHRIEDIARDTGKERHLKAQLRQEELLRQALAPLSPGEAE